MAELIKEELGKIIMESCDFAPNVLVSIVKVSVSSDLQWANVEVSIFPPICQQEVFNLLQGRVYFFQKILNNKLFMRHVPKLRFRLDKSIQKQAELDQAFKVIQNEDESSE